MSIQEVAMDLQRSIQRAAKATALSTKPELVNNVYPLMMSMLEAVEERFQNLEVVLAELVEGSASVVHEDLRGALDNVINLGMSLCDLVGQLKLDELNAKKAADIVSAYKEAVAIAVEGLDDAAVEDDEDEDGEGDEDDDGDDGEEGEDDEEGDEEIAAKDDK